MSTRPNGTCRNRAIRIDVFVHWQARIPLMEASVVPGCVVRTRIIGGIEAKQKEKGELWTKNDRLIAVAAHAQTYQKAETLSDLRPHLIDEIIEFFVDYNKLRNRENPGTLFVRRVPCENPLGLKMGFQILSVA